MASFTGLARDTTRDGGQVTAQKLLAVPNGPPVANAGGPYQITEGDSLTVDATATSDPNQSSSTLKYEWDLNGDGVYTDAAGSRPTLSWAQLQALGLGDGPSTFTARVRVTDDYGDSHIASAAGKIANLAPVLTSLSWPDRLRCTRVLGPIAVAVHCLFVKGLVFDGSAGLFYTAQRVTADMILSMHLLRRDLGK